MKVWHGSQKLFSEFSTDYFGTGERGSEAGWGLYFAEKRSGGEYYATYNIDRNGEGYLYTVSLTVETNEVLKLDQSKEDQVEAYDRAMSIFSKFTNGEDIRPSYLVTRLQLGDEEAALRLRDNGIKMLISSHGKVRHGCSLVVIDPGIITIDEWFEHDGKSWKQITQIEVESRLSTAT